MHHSRVLEVRLTFQRILYCWFLVKVVWTKMIEQVSGHLRWGWSSTYQQPIFQTNLAPLFLSSFLCCSFFPSTSGSFLTDKSIRPFFLTPLPSLLSLPLFLLCHLAFLFAPYFPPFSLYTSPLLTRTGGMRCIRCVQTCRARSSLATKRTLEKPSTAPK